MHALNNRSCIQFLFWLSPLSITHLTIPFEAFFTIQPGLSVTRFVVHSFNVRLIFGKSEKKLLKPVTNQERGIMW